MAEFHRGEGLGEQNGIEMVDRGRAAVSSLGGFVGKDDVMDEAGGIFDVLLGVIHQGAGLVGADVVDEYYLNSI